MQDFIQIRTALPGFHNDGLRWNQVSVGGLDFVRRGAVRWVVKNGSHNR